jgi:hypothetical protein
VLHTHPPTQRQYDAEEKNAARKKAGESVELSEAATATLSYLTLWDTARASWKFQKVRCVNVCACV